jgi:hypothetical protein
VCYGLNMLAYYGGNGFALSASRIHGNMSDEYPLNDI